MSKSKEEKVVLITPKQEEDKKEKKKNIVLIVLGSIAGFLLTTGAIIVIIFALISLGLIYAVNNIPHKSSDETYVVDKYTSNRYDNLLTYVNKEYHSLSQPGDIDTIYTFTISGPHLLLMCLKESTPIYVHIETGEADVVEMLNMFKDSSPAVGSFANTFQIESINNDLDKNVSKYIDINKPSHIIISQKGTENYISYLGMKDDKTFVSYTHGLYNNEGIYDTSLSITKSNKLLFDMYYYLLLEEH